MDPNAALAEAKEILADRDVTDEYLPRLADIFEALDDWLSKGGFLPDEWQSPEYKQMRDFYLNT